MHVDHSTGYMLGLGLSALQHGLVLNHPLGLCSSVALIVNNIEACMVTVSIYNSLGNLFYEWDWSRFLK